MTPFEIVPLFPQALYRAKFRPLTDNELEVISNYPVTKQQLGNHTSQEPYFLDAAGLEDLKAEFKKHIDVYAAEIMKVSWDLYLTNSWLNVNRPSEHHMIHNHSNSLISGVLYIRSSYIQPTITFNRMVSPYLITAEPEDFTPFNSMEWTVPVEDGNIILFPSKLFHYVKPNESNNDRVSLAFNTFARGEIRTRMAGADLILK
jgi:uncharacterized protein (TIGR02466 family)